jgi:hypothetical protein
VSAYPRMEAPEPNKPRVTLVVATAIIAFRDMLR